MAQRFTWDPRKAVGNEEKHGVSFEVASRAFADPFALSDQDRIEGGEYRWQTIGLVESVLLFVAYSSYEEADGTEVIHVISARRAERRERKRYEEERHRNLRA